MEPGLKADRSPTF